MYGTQTAERTWYMYNLGVNNPLDGLRGGDSERRRLLPPLPFEEEAYSMDEDSTVVVESHQGNALSNIRGWMDPKLSQTVEHSLRFVVVGQCSYGWM